MAADRSVTAIVIATLLVGSLVGAGLTVAAIGPAAPGADATGPRTDSGDGDVASVDQFGNESAFERYVERGRAMGDGIAFRGAASGAGGDGGGAPTRAEGDVAEEAPETAQPTMTEAQTEAPAADSSGDGPDRVGETNVQVASLDEPDRVKTDGAHFYYAPGPQRYHPRPVDGQFPDDHPVEPPAPPSETQVIDVGEPADPQAVAEIDATGQLLQDGDRVVVLGDEEVRGYDVSDPANPEEVWSQPLDDRLVTARERNGTVYLVTQTHVGGSPCPIEPLGADAAIPCGDVFRPDAQISVDATYSAFVLDAADGEVRDSVSFVGTGRDTAVYMSEDSLYVTYTSRTSRATLMADFLTEEFDRTPAHVEERIAELRSYDISESSMRRELSRTVRQWLDSLPADERRDVQRDLSDGASAYVADHQRDLTETGVVRIGATENSLTVEDTGTVPGRPLNQFSLSEYEGTLRIATTVPGAGTAQSVNDLYVLEADSLSVIGSETDMGTGQEVYAVRYVGETAYVVTFRQVDPLHVVDLSDPTDPVERGTLRLPGFSSYLHPVDDDHVLGIGEENGRVKAVLFDVSNPDDPEIADDHVLDARWSAVSQSHHAFTIDRRHGVFFLPTGRAGVVMDYTNGSLAVEDRIETTGAPERARYVDDYLYVFAGSEVAVVDETVWDRVATLDLTGD